jgi:hypothetical protein
MGVGRTQIMNILRRKRDILDDFENKTMLPVQRRVTGNCTLDTKYFW